MKQPGSTFGSEYEGENFRRYMRDVERLQESLHISTHFDSRKAMIHANLKLVVKIAGMYMGRGLSIMDIISEGNIGLMKAVDDYLPSMGKFSTFATIVIKRRIKRYLPEQVGAIQISEHTQALIARLNDAIFYITEEGGYTPSDHAIAEKMGISLKLTRDLRMLSKHPISLNESMNRQYDQRSGESDKLDSSKERPEDMLQISLSSLLVSRGRMNRNGVDLKKISKDEENTPDDIVAQKDYFELIRALIKELDDREQFILEHYYGLNGKTIMTLEDIGENFGLGKDRISQIRNKALKKLQILIQKLKDEK